MPARYRAIVERIYAELAASVEIRSGAPLGGEGRLVATYRSVVQAGMIQVQQPGANMPSAIARTLQSLVGAARRSSTWTCPWRIHRHRS